MYLSKDGLETGGIRYSWFSLDRIQVVEVKKTSIPHPGARFIWEYSLDIWYSVQITLGRERVLIYRRDDCTPIDEFFQGQCMLLLVRYVPYGISSEYICFRRRFQCMKFVYTERIREYLLYHLQEKKSSLDSSACSIWLLSFAEKAEDIVNKSIERLAWD